MKRLICFCLSVTLAAGLTACSKPEKTVDAETVIPVETVSHSKNEVQDYLSENYAGGFTLWCPDGHDLYAFYVYPDHAERRCDLLMPAGTDDVEEHIKDLSWKIDDDDLIFSGDWEESLKIDVTAHTAISNSTGKVYRIMEMQTTIPAEGETGKTDISNSETGANLPRMIRVNGIIYTDTGKESAVTARCGNMDGQVTSAVAPSETPIEDNQSNFGTGYGYQYGPEDNTIEIHFDKNWLVFRAE